MLTLLFTKLLFIVKVKVPSARANNGKVPAQKNQKQEI